MRHCVVIAALLTSLLSVTGFAGEYKDHCATGLAIYEVLVETDCSVNWTDSRSERIYCFSSEAAMEEFLEDTDANIAKADKKFVELGAN
jgi:hypothetical protein